MKFVAASVNALIFPSDSSNFSLPKHNVYCLGKEECHLEEEFCIGGFVSFINQEKEAKSYAYAS